VHETETGIIAFVAWSVLIQILFTLALHFWGRWVARRQAGRWWRRASWLPLLGLALSATGMIWGSLSLVRAFQSVASVDPSQKATHLAEAISSAMNCAALLAPPSWACYLTALVVFIVGSARRPRDEVASSDGEPG